MNVYDKATGLLSNGKDDAYYEGTFWNYSFRQLPDMEKRIALCPVSPPCATTKIYGRTFFSDEIDCL